ncbi:hypothetical protein ASZ90_017566 [hydrocarbon metagenome]|uniref:Uncharacterized protein n=1 Tax=hydrocarbon metagenome TaxID=938273 RepID=A0A0W8E8Y1_9ZZZZ
MLLITAAILFTIIIIKLTPISPIWLFVILLGAVINTIASKQIKTLGTIAIIVIALYTAPLMAAGYTNLSPELQSSGEIVARIYCIALLLGAVIFNVYYKGQGDTVLNSINLSLPQISKSKLESDEITHPPVEICRKASNPMQRIELSGKDRYLHTLLIGSTGTGKTSAVLQPSVWQDLVNYKNGQQLGITVVAPDAEFCHTVRDWCKTLGIPYAIIDLDDPNTSRFNPLEGDPIIVSEIMRTVLRATFGEQEAFFAQAQELHAKNTMMLLKRLKGNNLTLLDVYNSLMDIEGVQNDVDEYIRLFGTDIVTTYFQKEAFGKNRDKLHQFAMGLRMQISDLLANDTVYNVLVGKSDIDLDKHMNEGGVLLVNTALGKMGHMSRTFGQFLIMHIQNAVFRRPGTEFTRIPHYLYIDELPVYFNPELENLLNMGRKYRCACTFTIQGPSQLEKGKHGQAMREIIINGCRNKIVIGIESSKDAKLVSELLGENKDKEVRITKKRFNILPESYSETDKDIKRFTYTDVLEIPPWHGLVKIVHNGRNSEPVLGKFEEPWIFLERVEKEISKHKKHRIIQQDICYAG